MRFKLESRLAISISGSPSCRRGRARITPPGGDEEFIPVCMRSDSLKWLEILLRLFPRPDACTVGQIKMGDAQVKGPAKNLPLFFQGFSQTEISARGPGNAGEVNSASCRSGGISWYRTGFLLLHTYRLPAF